MTACPRCLFQQRVCLCAEIPTVVTETRVVIVRHHLEQHRSSNSGRLAHFALPNSEIIEHGGRGGPAALPSFDGAWVLFAIGAPTTTRPVPPPRQLVVLDATWSQAGRMYRKLGALRGLPVLRLPEGALAAAATRERMRESPGPGQVSTIEAIAAALRIVEGPGGEAAATALEQLFQVAAGRAIASGRLGRLPGRGETPTLDS